MLLFRLVVNEPRHNSVQLVLFLTVFPIPGNRVGRRPLSFEKRFLFYHFTRPSLLLFKTLTLSFIPNHPYALNLTNICPKYISSIQRKWTYKLPWPIIQTHPLWRGWIMTFEFWTTISALSPMSILSFVTLLIPFNHVNLCEMYFTNIEKVNWHNTPITQTDPLQREWNITFCGNIVIINLYDLPFGHSNGFGC